MHRSAPLVPLALCVGALLLTACGQAPADNRPGGALDAPGAPDVPPAVSSAEATRRAVEEHDRLWPEIAARCAETAPEDLPGEDAGGENDAEAGGVPENPRHGENNGYRRTAEVSPAERCRGEAHAVRIAAAMTDEDGLFGDVETTTRLLKRLGYEPDGIGVEEAGTGVATWFVTVPGAGPCVTGHTGMPHADPGDGVHGVYLEGTGCRMPKGGH
ncbi:hypothetical protein GCM10027160_06590 [Streptomyces calidiresistens]|uniref:Lipoprotein n=1 Tax=Streptomyces calidiresistens TaxID=1485586 RepID=A0A7W3T7Y7_9ACTN|nr:hypothetical protein [Streptomyces calidiresistens]MBB0232635.1 hypothetical protein [Streptomyces calidiresistens]